MTHPSQVVHHLARLLLTALGHQGAGAALAVAIAAATAVAGRVGRRVAGYRAGARPGGPGVAAAPGPPRHAAPALRAARPAAVPAAGRDQPRRARPWRTARRCPP